MEKPCLTCGKIFKKPHSKSLRDWIHRSKYCSRTCSARGIGIAGWNKGKKFPEWSGEKHHNWKGDKVGYGALHMWVRHQYGKPLWCMFCMSVQNVHWANISHKYKRDIHDWMELCVKCHRKYDDSTKQMQKARGFEGLKRDWHGRYLPRA